MTVLVYGEIAFSSTLQGSSPGMYLSSEDEVLTTWVNNKSRMLCVVGVVEPQEGGSDREQ